MTRQGKIIIAAIICIIVFFVGLTIWVSYNSNNKSSLSIQLGIPLKSVSITINGKQQGAVSAEEVDSGEYDFSLKSGSYSVKVSKQGYKDFTANVHLNRNQSDLLNVNLLPLVKPSASDLSKILTVAVGSSVKLPLSTQYPQNTTASAQYFDNNNWAFVTMNVPSGVGQAYFIDNYDSTSGQWVLVTTPSDVVDVSAATMPLPADLQQFLITNNFIAGSNE